MTAKRNPGSVHRATPKRRTRVEVRTQFVRALRDGMQHARMYTGGKPSSAKLARELSKTTRTARRVLSGKQKLDVETLACGPLWPHFLRCLMMHERKGRVI